MLKFFENTMSDYYLRYYFSVWKYVEQCRNSTCLKALDHWEGFRANGIT